MTAALAPGVRGAWTTPAVQETCAKNPGVDLSSSMLQKSIGMTRLLSAHLEGFQAEDEDALARATEEALEDKHSLPPTGASGSKALELCGREGLMRMHGANHSRGAQGELMEAIPSDIGNELTRNSADRMAKASEGGDAAAGGPPGSEQPPRALSDRVEV
eukprot:CAMPEP_0179117824 /NCGR_PEP_ID=MMETSP0796-20121207/55366_1 /TAXON_ID=73915 /ORGANISM="Pyrodinium bahamense, Strain pbaha01" /LENGTH=159 /DNA_ID=CAMNT_0020816221 /DNA_START=11 /DNA_END=489 /DNA_ORIENTATION=-